MERSKLYTALGALSAVLEDGHILSGVGQSIITKIDAAYQELGNLLDEPVNKRKETVVKEEPSTLKFSSDDLHIQIAYAIMSAESKPTYQVLKRELGKVNIKIGVERAKKLLASLVEDGHITIVGDKAASKTTASKTTTKPKNPKAAAKPKKTKKAGKLTFVEVLEALPKGDHPLLNSPFKYLIVLDEKARKPYLKGLVIEDMISSDSLAEATERGADLSLVKQVIALSEKKRKPVKDAIEGIGTIGDKRDKKLTQVIAQCVNIITNGDTLFNHMAAAGANMQVLKDLQTIAKAVKNNEV